MSCTDVCHKKAVAIIIQQLTRLNKCHITLVHVKMNDNKLIFVFINLS